MNEAFDPVRHKLQPLSAGYSPTHEGPPIAHRPASARRGRSFSDLDSIGYDSSGAPTGVTESQSSPARAFGRGALSGALDTAAAPVVAGGRLAAALGYENPVANISAQDAIESLEYLARGKEPAEVRREDTADAEWQPLARTYGENIGSVAGGYASGALGARLNPATGTALQAVTAKKRATVEEYRAQPTMPPGKGDASAAEFEARIRALGEGKARRSNVLDLVEALGVKGGPGKKRKPDPGLEMEPVDEDLTRGGRLPMREESFAHLRANPDKVNEALPVRVAMYPGSNVPVPIDGRHRIALARERGENHITGDVYVFDKRGNEKVRKGVKIPIGPSAGER